MRHRQNAHGIMFHHFYDDKHPKGQGAISAEQLEAIIDFYMREHVILSARQWLKKENENRLRRRDVCLTFDDALLNQYEVALPVLEHYGITAFWFVYSSVVDGGIEMLEVYRKFRTTCFKNVGAFYASFFSTLRSSAFSRQVESSLIKFSQEKYLAKYPFYSAEDKRFRYLRDIVLGEDKYNTIMNRMMRKLNIDIEQFSSDLWLGKSQLMDLHAKGHVIGMHSHRHPTRLSDLPPRDQLQEYQLNYEILSNILNEAPETMSHPCNSYTRETLSILENLGIRVGFRANMETRYTTTLEYPREDHANILRRSS